MRSLITGRGALLAGVLGIVAAVSVVALLQLQSVNEQVFGSGEEEPATNAKREATDDHIGDKERPASPLDPSAGPSTEEPESDPRSETGEAELAELEEEVRGISASHRGGYGVVLWQPGSGRKVSVGSGERFEAASLAKLPVLLALYREAEQGRLSLDERVEIKPSDIKSGTGELQDRPPGTKVTLRECAEYLMKESDNTAWALLEDRLGNDRIRSEIRSVGASSTGYEYAKHPTTPDDTLKMLRKISEPSYTSPRYSRQMLGYMSGTSFEDWLPQGLPEEARISHKIGILGDGFADAGIVYPPQGEGSSQPYYVVVQAKDTTEPQARAAMQEISLAAYRGFVDPEAEPRSERGSPKASLDQRQ